VRSAVLCTALAACSPTYSEGPPAGDGGADAAVAPCTGKADWDRIVFVSSDVGDGKLAEGGLTGADGFCQRLADASSSVARGRSFRAWLSTASTPAAGRLTRGTRPYRRVDGVQVHASLEAFSQRSLEAPMNVDENGLVVATSAVWTGTEGDGTPNANNCNDWTATTQIAEGRQGSAAATNGEWASQTDAPCDEEARVYCFEN
jgi:hypothetical protein